MAEEEKEEAAPSNDSTAAEEAVSSVRGSDALAIPFDVKDSTAETGIDAAGTTDLAATSAVAMDTSPDVTADVVAAAAEKEIDAAGTTDLAATSAVAMDTSPDVTTDFVAAAAGPPPPAAAEATVTTSPETTAEAQIATNKDSSSRPSFNPAVQQALVESVEMLHVEVLKERDELAKEVLRLQHELTASRNEFMTLQQQVSTQGSDVLLKQQHEQKMQQLQGEIQLQQERMDRMQIEADRLRHEISNLTKSNTDLTTRLSSMQLMQSTAESSTSIAYVHEKERWQMQLNSLQQHATWLESELQTKSHALLQQQQQARDKATQLELQLASLRNQNEQLQTKVTVLQQVEASLQQNVSNSSNTVLQLRQEREQWMESHQHELLETNKLVEMQKQQLERYEKRYEDAKRDKIALQTAAQQALEQSRHEQEALRTELETKYQQLLQEQAQKYQEQLQKQQQSPAPALGGALPRLSLLPGTAAAAETAPPAADDEDSDMEEDGPVGITELYTRLERTKQHLRQARLQARQWQASFHRLQKDVERQAPKLVAQRENYERMLDEVVAVQNRCSILETDLASARKEAREARELASKHQRQARDKARETEELAKQVQALLVRDATKTSGNNSAPSISAVADIQNQNQRLLVEHRRLTDEVAALKNKLQEDQLRIQLDALKAECEELSRHRDMQEREVVRIVQQRDLYRLLLQKHDASLIGGESASGGTGGSTADELTSIELAKQHVERAKKLEQKNIELEGELATARSQLDSLNRAKDEAMERVARYEAHAAQMTEAVSRLERDLITSKSQTARSEADASYHKEKWQRLEESLQRARQEIDHVNHVKNELQHAVSETQQTLSKVTAEAARHESEKQQALMRLRLVETEAETAKAAEKRLIEETGQLRSELARQGNFIDSIRRIETSLSAKGEVEKEELKAEIQRLSQQLEQDKAKAAAAIETANGRVRLLEARIEELDAAKSKTQADALKAKEELLEAKTELQALSSKCEQLELQLKAAKTKLRESDDADDADPSASMAAKIESLELDLKCFQAEKKSLLEQAKNYQKIAKDSEQAFLELKAATEQAHEAQLREVEDLKAKLSAITNETETKGRIIKELTEQLAAQRGERENRETELKNRIQALEAQVKNDEKDVDSARAAVAAMKHDIETMKAEAEQTHNNYERELVLHSQARTALRHAREEAEEAVRLHRQSQHEVDTLNKQIENQLALFEREKKSLQDTANLLEKSLKEAREQNSVLHSQLETLSDMAEKVQASRVTAATSEEPVGDQEDAKVVTDLREVVKYLRSENELIQLQLDNAKSTVDRERASANVLRRSLDEARAELKHLQSSREGAQSDIVSDMEELRAKMKSTEDQVKLLNDSNKLLRNENDNLLKVQVTLQKELDASQQLVKPLEQKQQELQVKVASLEADKQGLTRDVDDWKNRVQSLVTKFNQVDPEVHNKLKAQVVELKKEKESLNAWKQTTEEESTRIRNIAKSLNLKNRELSKTIEDLRKEVERLSTSVPTTMAPDPSVTKEFEGLKAKVLEMEKQAASKATELEGTAKLNERLRERLRQFKTNLEEARNKEMQVSEQNAALKARAEELEAQLKQSSLQKQEVERSDATESSQPKAAPASEPKTTPALTTVEPSRENIAAPQEAKTAAPATKPRPPSVPEGGFKFGPSEIPQTRIASIVVKETGVSKSPSPVMQGKLTHTETDVTTRLEGPIKVEASVSTLKPDAKPFVPSGMTAAQVPQDESHKGVQPPEAGKSESVAATTLERRGSTEKKELSFKQKLLEKKRKLEELARKRQREAEAATKTPEPKEAAGGHQQSDDVPATRAEAEDQTKLEAQEDEPVCQQPIKRVKMDKDEPSSPPSQPEKPVAEPLEAGTVDSGSEKLKSDEKPVAEPLAAGTVDSGSEKSKSDGELPENPSFQESTAEGSDQATSSKPIATKPIAAPIAAESRGGSKLMEDEVVKDDDAVVVDEAAVDETEEMDAAADAKEEEPMEEETATAKSDTPFGMGSGVPFGSTAITQPSWGANIPTFGQSSSLTGPTTFGMKPTVASTGSSSFLNIKPPGSSASPPVFTFGNSGSITLPTPSLPTPTASPFAAFGTSTTSFGTFGAAPPASMAALPLFASPFGSIVANAPAETTDEGGAEEMDDEEGEMDAEV